MSHDTASRERAHRRNFQRRRRRIGTAFVLASALAGLGIGAGQVWLRIESIAVQSTDVALADEVTEIIRVPADANLLTSDLNQFALQAQEHPRVGKVDVDRQMPSGLELTVQPREPIMALRRDDRYLLVDTEGVCLQWTNDPSQGVLRIEALPEEADLADAADVGGRFSGPWFERSRTLALSLDDADDLGPWTMDASYPPELALVTHDGVRGIVGAHGDIERRARLFAELLRDLKSRQKNVGKMELRTERPVWWSVGKAAAGSTGRST